MTWPDPTRRASPTEPAVPGRSPHQLTSSTPPLTRLHIEQMWQEAHIARELRSTARRASWRSALGEWLRRLAARLDPGQPEATLEQL